MNFSIFLIMTTPCSLCSGLLAINALLKRAKRGPDTRLALSQIMKLDKVAQIVCGLHKKTH